MDKTPHHRTGVGAGVRLKQWLAQLLVRSSCTTNATKTATTSATSFVSLDKANANANPHQEPRHSPDFCICTYKRPNLEEGGGGSRRHRRRSTSVVHDSIDYTYTGEGFGRRSVHSDVAFLSSSLPTNDAKKHSNKSRGKPGSPSMSRRNLSYSSCQHVQRPRRNSMLYSCSSSTVTDESGKDAEMTTLFSYLSSSSDSTVEFYRSNSSNASRKSHSNARRRAPRHARPRTRDPPEAFRPRVTLATKHQQCKNMKKEEDAIKKMGVEKTGVVGEGMAVVKRSSNPYADFRSSMVEIVVERRIASVGKMEELLESYLSLNSPEHHPAIIAAFEYVWETVLGDAFQPRVTSATKNQQCKNIKKEVDAIKKMGVEKTGVVGTGMAVVKRSSNPYADFRSSMVEMVVECRIASVGKMEELLESYLSLNSPEHHPAIIAAFEDVWESSWARRESEPR